ncbi:MAG TPA: hypothetical protein VM432_10025 [Bdellovibrionales bacterium]|jgi:hypothetical protein|nr:hypothetical protein [Bdellovibrionales bacterium]
MKNQLILGLLLGLSVGTLTSSIAYSQVAEAEPLLGYQPFKHSIAFQVNSGGCTSKNDFVVTRKVDSEGVTLLKLIRIRIDPCRPYFPTGERIRFSYEEIGIEPATRYQVLNGNGVINGWIWGNETTGVENTRRD